MAFTVSAGFAGAAGGMFIFLNGYVSPDSFTLQTSILFLLALLFGGEGTVAGPAIGSLILAILPELLTSLTDYRLILYGGLLMCSIYWLPAGVVGAFRSKRSGEPAAEQRPPTRDASAASPGLDRDGDEDGRTMQLQVEGVSLSFGGVAALANVSVTIPAHGIHAVIGPNGAGKTTLLNALSGYYAPDAGAIRLGGKEIAGRPPYAIARRGVARTFQTAQVFGDLSVLENVAVGIAGPRLGGVVPALLGLPTTRRKEVETRRSALKLLELAGLADWADRPADALPAGLRRRLEIVRALARRPRFLLLDEPAAGLSPTEVKDLDAHLTALAQGGGPAIVLVEHHMDLVMAVSDQISVLDYGRVIASGTPEAVRSHPAVIEAYLGVAA
jgi:ABC-type branched-subunit amino acid transport system ATPase component